MEQVKTFRHDLSHREDLDQEINAWLKEAGVKISRIHRDVYERKNAIGIRQPSFGVLTTVVYRERE